ncbi:hypothetical protein KH172YL63_36130 [Bacillus sp. KH172YL63]|nr:hypothetical protein KH172YL63_36130 [Bacillus sp. KH172YL63]
METGWSDVASSCFFMGDGLASLEEGRSGEERPNYAINLHSHAIHAEIHAINPDCYAMILESYAINLRRQAAHAVNHW